MSYAPGEFPVYFGGKKAGSLTVAQNGLMTVFSCSCVSTDKDVLRLAAVCSGRYVPLGVLMPTDDSAPEEGVLRLYRRYSKNALASLGYSDTETFRLLRPAEMASSPETEPDIEMAAAVPSVPAQPAYLPILPAEENKPPTEAPKAVNPPVPSKPAAKPNPPLAKTETPVEKLEPARPQESSLPAPKPEPPLAKIEPPAEKPIHIEGKPAFTPPSASLQPVQTPVVTNPESPGSKAPEPPRSPSPPARSETVEENTEPALVGGWKPISSPGTLFDDAGISGSCEGVTGALVTEQDALTLLAVPFSPDKPFPLMPVFCFGYPTEIAGRDYILFKIKNGNLTL